MFFKTHIAFSFFIFLIIQSFLDNTLIPIWFLAIVFLFGAIFPDIDCSNSFLGRKIKPFSWFFRHRGFFHSIFPAVIVVLIFWSFDYLLGVMFFLGYVTHLFLDMLNYQGVALFFPFSKKRIKGIFYSGKIADKIIYYICFLGIILFILFD